MRQGQSRDGCLSQCAGDHLPCVQRQKAYEDLGADYFDHLDKQCLANQSIKRLEALGFRVTVEPREEVST
jgi:hypothetical protein